FVVGLGGGGVGEWWRWAEKWEEMWCSGWQEKRNSKAYKEYYACATREATPKPKASAKKKKGNSASSTTPPTPTPTTTIVSAPRLSATAKGKQPARAITPTKLTDVERTKAKQLKIALKRSRQETHVSQQRGSEGDEQTKGREESKGDKTDESDDASDDDMMMRLSRLDLKVIKMMKAMMMRKSLQRLMLRIQSLVRVVMNDAGVESIFTTASSPIVSLQTPTPIMTPSTIATITTSSDAPIPPTTIPSIILENLLTFNSAFRFDERLRSLETTFSEYRQTNPFVDAVYAIPGIVHQYMTQQITEAVREVVQIQTDRLQDSLQRENDEFLRNINEHMKKIIKGQVKSQVKDQVSRILPRIEESVNATLEAEVLTRSSHSSRTSYAIAADLSEMELKKILIKKMEGNKSIQRSDEQRNLYKALVKAYDADNAILDTYGESTILKRRREDDDQEGPSTGSDRGSKRQKEGGEHASASTPSETATGGAGRTTTGSQFRQLSASESAFAEEPVQTTYQMEEPLDPVFETGANDQPIVQTSQHPEWFSQPRRPPSSDRDWNKTLPAAQGDA
nr:hypothetical protein [Tanacetum cinerariifolium]